MSRSAASEIHLDTSFLIRALVRGSGEASTLRRWLQEGHDVALSTLAWGEFLCGPLPDGAEALAHRVARRHVSLGSEEVAELGTCDEADFRRFSGEGLRLAE